MTLNGDGKGGFQSHFRQHSVTIQSTEWQVHFCDLSVSYSFLNKHDPNLRCMNQRECSTVKACCKEDGPNQIGICGL